MDEYLIKACKRLGVEVGQVLSHKFYAEDDKIVLVVNYGIAGGKKYSLSLSELDRDTPSEEKEEKTKPKTKTDSDLDSMTVKELRAIAKELGLKGFGNMKRETLLVRVGKGLGIT